MNTTSLLLIAGGVAAAALLVFLMIPKPVDLPDTYAECPVTAPNGSVPPGEEANATEFYHGEGGIWTVLWPEGRVRVPELSVDDDGSMGMKWPWWRTQDPIEVSGYYLGGKAAPLEAGLPSGYGESGFRPSGLRFSTEGCWEIMATSGGATLTAIQWVEIDR